RLYLHHFELHRNLRYRSRPLRRGRSHDAEACVHRKGDEQSGDPVPPLRFRVAAHGPGEAVESFSMLMAKRERPSDLTRSMISTTRPWARRLSSLMTARASSPWR